MFSFQKFVFNHYSKPWILLCFVSVLLSVVNPSNAQGDPTRIPTADELAGLKYKLYFDKWPACASLGCGYQAALNSSTEEWCSFIFFGSCSQTDVYVRMPKFCSIIVSPPCRVDQCILPQEPESLLSWVNDVCALTSEEMGSWNESTLQRNEFKKWSDNRPSCSDTCSELDTSIRDAIIPGSGFSIDNLCARLEGVDGCPNQCTFGNEPRQLFSWIDSNCGDKVNVMEKWRRETMAKEEAWILYQWIPTLLPWNWTVQAFQQPPTLATMGIQLNDPKISSLPYFSTVPPSGPGICKTSTIQKLGVFAAVNIVSAALTPILGRRTVMNRLTFGYLGNLGSNWWPYIGVFFAALHLFSNLLNAYVIHSTPGYENVPIKDLVLLWCTRPRLSWLAVYLATIQAEEGMYFGSAASSLTCEAILQVFGAAYFGITAHYGRNKGFYYIGHLDPYPRGRDAHIMYAGALLWLVAFFFTLMACFACLIGLGSVIEKAREMMKEYREHPGTFASVLGDRAPEWLRRTFSAVPLPRELTKQEIHDLESIGAASIIFVSFLAQWLFWAGFVMASQERYCPPKLLSLGIIWSLFSATGIFLGSVQ